MTNPIQWTAREAVTRLKSGDISPMELIEAACARIDAVDKAVNAMVTRCRDRAEAMAGHISKDSLLAGLPIGIKDLSEVKGVLTTFGSPIFDSYIPDFSDLPVAHLEAAGGLVIAKTNTPEFGAGANTFNAVFGMTRNPWNTSRSCAGSSGGSAAALATGQCWLASGSDLGGSLRTPAGFCGIVGLRPSPGRVARLSASDPFGTLSVEGPMARNAADVALMLDAMAGRDPRDPLSQPRPVTGFLETCLATAMPKRIAYSIDLGGIIPVDPEIRRVTQHAVDTLRAAGVEMVEKSPDFSTAIETFKVLRGLGFVNAHWINYRDHKEKLKDDVIWNIEYGKSLTADQIARALRNRAAIQAAALSVLREDAFDALMVPTAIVPPYPAEQPWVAEVNGHVFDNYIHWLAPVSAVTLTGLPSVSVPAGFTDERLPVGIQLVGLPMDEGVLLGHAHRVEAVLGARLDTPIDPIPG